MAGTLNITNGDSAARVMKDAGVPGDILPWRDVLHEGPVPSDLSLEELSGVRVSFMAGQGWAPREEVRRSFAERDSSLRSCEDSEKVVLWFEHDLYDQLQLIQVLDWFSRRVPGKPKLSMICAENYLGMLTPGQMRKMSRHEVPVSQDQLTLARRAWSAFRSPTPENLFGLLAWDTTSLPFLEGAVLRLLEEYPNKKTGLSRTEFQALKVISQGERVAGRVFKQYQETEDRMFLGDSGFWRVLDGLLAAKPALLQASSGEAQTVAWPHQELLITPRGSALAKGRGHVERPELDRWIGGVHLTPNNLWCWDAETRTIAKRD